MDVLCVCVWILVFEIIFITRIEWTTKLESYCLLARKLFKINFNQVDFNSMKYVNYDGLKEKR